MQDDVENVCPGEGVGDHNLASGPREFDLDLDSGDYFSGTEMGEISINPLASLSSTETGPAPTNDGPHMLDGTSLYAGIDVSLSTPLTGKFSAPTIGLLRDNATGDFGLKVCSPSYSLPGNALAVGSTLAELTIQKGGVAKDLFTSGWDVKHEVFAAYYVGIKFAAGGELQTGTPSLGDQMEGGLVLGKAVGSATKTSVCGTVNLSEALDRASKSVNNALFHLTTGIETAVRGGHL